MAYQLSSLYKLAIFRGFLFHFELFWLRTCVRYTFLCNIYTFDWLYIYVNLPCERTSHAVCNIEGKELTLEKLDFQIALFTINLFHINSILQNMKTFNYIRVSI